MMIEGSLMDYEKLINIPQEEQAKRYREMVLACFCHLTGEDNLGKLHPRRMIDIKRRVDGVETWFEGDWLTTLMRARDGHEISKYHHLPSRESVGQHDAK